MTLGYRLRRAWRRLAAQFTPAQRPPRDIEAEAIAAAEALIARLEICAAIGSVTAAGQLACLAEDRVGVARRRLASEAVHRLRSRAPINAEVVA